MNSLNETFDVAVIGLGAMGASSLYQLARRGKNVIGIDQFSPPHTLGSTHGDTRVTRLAIGEGNHYVPLALRSHEIWREIESESGSNLLFEVGGVVMGDPTSKTTHHNKTGFLERTVSAAKKFGIEHEILDAAEIRRRYPQFAVNDGEMAYFEPRMGYLRPEACVKAQIDLAKQRGAKILVNQKVLEIDPSGNQVIVRTADGSSYRAEQVVLSVGPWISRFFPDGKNYFRIYRQALYWLKYRGPIDQFQTPAFPVFIWSFPHAIGDGIYGFPAIDGTEGGVKIAAETYHHEVSPDEKRDPVPPEEISKVFEACIRDRIPALSPESVKTATCLYTTTPDGDFVVQRHPAEKRILIMSPCSGHGFKHSAALGEAVAELTTVGSSKIDLESFKIKNLKVCNTTGRP